MNQRRIVDRLWTAVFITVFGALWVGWYIAPIWVNVVIGIPAIIGLVGYKLGKELPADKK